MTVSQILMLATALILFFFFCVILYAMFIGTCEDLARVALKARQHTKR